MGLRAVYVAVDEATLDDLVAAPAEDLVDALDRLQQPGTPSLDLDKLWDGLHFLLTGVSANDPIEDDGLSEAVVGVHVFEAEDFVGCTELDELPAVIEALQGFPLDERLAGADVAEFGRAGIYPNTWDSDPVALRSELGRAFADLLDFHRTCLARQQHLVVSIL